MSHPYSGAASYIYANEYRAEDGIINGYNALPSSTTKKSYNYYPPQPVEIDIRVNQKRPDARDRGDSYSRTRAGMLKPNGTPTTSFSPSSQASSLPTSQHTHSRSNSNSNHQQQHQRNGSGQNHPHHSRTYTLTSTPSHPYSTTTSSGNHTTTTTNDPFAYPPRSRSQPGRTRQLDKDLPKPPPPGPPPNLPPTSSHPLSQIYSDKKPASKLKFKKPKFKLTLPNPFHFFRSFSPPTPKSPVWPSPPTSASLAYRNPKHSHPQEHSTVHPPSSSSRNRPTTYYTTSADIYHNANNDDDDPSSSNWRWSNPGSPSSKSRLSRWLSISSTVKSKSSSGTLRSKSTTAASVKRSNSKNRYQFQKPANGNTNNYNNGTGSGNNTAIVALPTVVERPTRVASSYHRTPNPNAHAHEDENDSTTSLVDMEMNRNSPPPHLQPNRHHQQQHIGENPNSNTQVAGGRRNRSLKFAAQDVGTRIGVGTGRRAEKELDFNMVPV